MRRTRAAWQGGASGVRCPRPLYPGSSLADLYDPLTMPPELSKGPPPLSTPWSTNSTAAPSTTTPTASPTSSPSTPPSAPKPRWASFWRFEPRMTPRDAERQGGECSVFSYSEKSRRRRDPCLLRDRPYLTRLCSITMPIAIAITITITIAINYEY